MWGKSIKKDYDMSKNQKFFRFDGSTYMMYTPKENHQQT